MAKRRAAERRERIVRFALISGLVAFTVWFLFLRGGTPDAIAGHQLENYDIAVPQPPHISGTVDYEMSPPVSGQHNVAPAACGTHAEPITNENFVHTLEHGAVGIVYRPTLPISDVVKIEALVDDYDSHVLSAPYEGEMETPIAVTAWGHIMRLDSYDEAAIEEFIEVFRRGGDAPEANQTCDNSANENFQPSPQASPGGEPSPDGRRSPEGRPSPGDRASPGS